MRNGLQYPQNYLRHSRSGGYLQGMEQATAELGKNDLIDVALAVREAALHLRKSLRSPVKLYPEQGQDALTRLLALHLGSLGQTVAVSSGTDLAPSVLLSGRAVVDLTFRGERAPLVEVDRYRQRQGMWKSPLEGITEARAYHHDLALVQAFLLTPAPELRFQPFVPVVDRWWGMDVLECGHLITPKRATSRSHNRRCRYCAPVLPASVYRVVADAEVLDWFGSMTDEERGVAIGKLRKSGL